MDFELAISIFIGYILTIVFETAVLVLGLSSQHNLRRKIIAGVWLTACSYPFVVYLFPMLIIPLTGQFTYILIAESFAPIFECFLFWLVYYKFKGADKSGLLRDMSTIVIANFFSYGMGLVLESFGITF